MHTAQRAPTYRVTFLAYGNQEPILRALAERKRTSLGAIMRAALDAYIALEEEALTDENPGGLAATARALNDPPALRKDGHGR